MKSDKQLRSIRLADVLRKRRLDQALNAKEFAVLAGVSYSIAREWFRLSGFPTVRGVVFWQDFVHWRTAEHKRQEVSEKSFVMKDCKGTTAPLPPRAANILTEAS